MNVVLGGGKGSWYASAQSVCHLLCHKYQGSGFFLLQRQAQCVLENTDWFHAVHVLLGMVACACCLA